MSAYFVGPQVFVFREKGKAVTGGHLHTWGVLAESELEARLRLQTKYKLYDRELELFEQFPDRRAINREGG